MARFDRYTVGSPDGFLAEGGRVSLVRFDPAGFEDCARDWQPCECHGDRLCRLGQKMRWDRTAEEHAAWLRGERETPPGTELVRLAGRKEQWEVDLKAKQSDAAYRKFWQESRPMLLTCAAEDRSWQYFDQIERQQEAKWA